MQTQLASLVSISKAVSVTHALPERIRKVAADLGVVPAMKIDGRELFTEDDVHRIAWHIEQLTQRT